MTEKKEKQKEKAQVSVRANSREGKAIDFLEVHFLILQHFGNVVDCCHEAGSEIRDLGLSHLWIEANMLY